MTLKLSRVDAFRREAEERIDHHFALKMNSVIGSLGALHALKRLQAMAGDGCLVNGDRDKILERAAAQDAALASLDRQRMEMKAAVRAACSSTEVAHVLSGLS